MIADKCVVALSQNLDQNVSNLGEDIKDVFWVLVERETLCEERLLKGRLILETHMSSLLAPLL